MNVSFLLLGITLIVSGISWLGLMLVPGWVLGLLALVTGAFFVADSFTGRAVKLPLRRQV